MLTHKGRAINKARTHKRMPKSPKTGEKKIKMPKNNAAVHSSFRPFGCAIMTRLLTNMSIIS